MPVTETSKAAYRWMQNHGLAGACRERIFRAAINLRECTRRELERATGLRPNQIAGRVNELIKCGSLVKIGERTDLESGRVVEVLAPVRQVMWDFLLMQESAA